MANTNSYSSKWPRVNRSTYGLPNTWYQSKNWGHLRRKQQLDFIQRKLKKERQDQVGSCMKQISEECKNMLKNKMQEVMQYNNTLNHPQPSNTAQNKYKNYKCFQCKQLGHIIKFCPMDNKDEDMPMKTDTRNLARGKMEGFKTTKPIVMLKYPESIHFSTTCMIRGTDLANWDDIWYVSNQIDKHVCYKLDTFCNIKEDFSVTKLENQMKFLFTYDLLEKQGFEVKYDGNRCTLSYMFNNKEIQIFDEDKMRTMQNKYLEDYFESITKKDEDLEQDLEWDFFRNRFNKIHLFHLYKLIEGLGGYLGVYFCQEFDTIGEIMGMSRGNEEEIKKCYINYIDVLTSHFKTARAPQQGCKNTFVESAWKAEDKDRDCLGPHQWDFGENGAPMTRPAVLRGKKTLEHFDVKLEDTRDSQEQPILPYSTKGHKLQEMYSRPSTSRM
ncbi:ARID DNA-binding domain-containing protein [Tanacetum coccineum]